MNENILLDKWLKEMTILLKKTYPTATKEEIKEYLKDQVKKNYKDEEVKMYNNYENTVKVSTCSNIENFYYSKYKPIATEHGTFFKPSPDNPAVLMLMEQKKERKIYKKLRDQSDKESKDYAKYDLYQSLKKISMNSYYGASGASSSIYYNIHCATAITGKGQSIISTATQAFEAFLANNSVFFNDAECIVFIKNCLKDCKKSNIMDYIDYVPHIDQVIAKLKSTYQFEEDCDEDLLFFTLKNCTEKELSMIYYKNNLYEFINNSEIMQNLIEKIVLGCDNFVDPNKPPQHMVDTLDEAWEILRDCVFYNYMITDRVYRLKNNYRKAVMIIDTDSNMINMHPWACMVRDKIVDGIPHNKSYNELRYNSLSTIAYFLSKLIRLTYDKFMKFSNVPKEKWEMLKMKNEYLYKRMLISSGKKNYVGLVEYKEGKYMDFQLDVKGLPIDKISSNAEASDFFKGLVKYDILKSDEIDIPEILSKLQDFQENMVRSLRNGERTFLKPVRVKEAKYYDNPLAQQAVRAVYLWNELYPEIEIEAPDTVYVAKLTLKREADLELIKDSDPEMYHKIKEKVFNSEIPTIREKGVYVIAIPRLIEEIPNWILPYIDTDTIVHDNMKNIVRILESLSLRPIASNASDGHFGNIVRI